jgi:hypothetical protein
MHQPPVMTPPEVPIVRGFMRSPIPPIYATNPDSQRTFYKGGKVPQFRAYTVLVNR